MIPTAEKYRVEWVDEGSALQVSELQSDGSWLTFTYPAEFVEAVKRAPAQSKVLSLGDSVIRLHAFKLPRGIRVVRGFLVWETVPNAGGSIWQCLNGGGGVLLFDDEVSGVIASLPDEPIVVPAVSVRSFEDD